MLNRERQRGAKQLEPRGVVSDIGVDRLCEVNKVALGLRFSRSWSIH